MATQRQRDTSLQEIQLKLLYGDDNQFKYWETHLFNEVYLKHDLREKNVDVWSNTEDINFQNFLNFLKIFHEQFLIFCSTLKKFYFFET